MLIPDLGDPAAQRLAVAVVVDHVVGPRQPLLRDWPGSAMRARASASRHPPLLDQPGDGDLRVDVDDDRAPPCRRGPTRPGAGTSRITTWSVSDSAARRRRDLGADGRVDDRVEVLQRLLVGEHDVGHRLTVQLPVGERGCPARSARPSAASTGWPGGLHLVDDRVGVDHDRAQLGQEGRHGGLPRPDAPGQPHHDHPGRVGDPTDGPATCRGTPCGDATAGILVAHGGACLSGARAVVAGS